MAPYIRGVPYIRVDGVIYTSLSSQIYDLFMNYSLILLEASQTKFSLEVYSTSREIWYIWSIGLPGLRVYTD